jgi:hypothetical protein
LSPVSFGLAVVIMLSMKLSLKGLEARCA